VKFLLLPAAILAFIVFLAVLGAIGLGVAFVLLSLLGRLWRLVTRTGRREAA
jgi:hypothetical protein